VDIPCIRSSTENKLVTHYSIELAFCENERVGSAYDAELKKAKLQSNESSEGKEFDL
jgi:hypothetical protein